MTGVVSLPQASFPHSFDPLLKSILSCDLSCDVKQSYYFTNCSSIYGAVEFTEGLSRYNAMYIWFKLDGCAAPHTL
jgi:hypothetical protein